MIDLVEFLRARCDEDRAWADNPECAEDPARVLREVEAKQAIVDYESDGHLRGLHIDAWGIWRDQLKSLAAVYAGHPDYREEWRP